MTFRSAKIMGIMLFSSMAVLLGCMAYIAAYTTQGAEWILETFLEKRYAVSIKKGSIQGCLAKTVTVKNIELDHTMIRSHAAQVKIQKATLGYRVQKGWLITLTHGQIRRENKDPILFYGEVRDMVLDMYGYSKTLSITDLEPVLSDVIVRAHPKGYVEDMDVHLSGPLNHITCSGTTVIHTASIREMVLKKVSVTFELAMTKQDQKLLCHGYVAFHDGFVSAHKTAVIQLKESTLTFVGDKDAPILDIHGESRIGKVDITLSVRGQHEDPKITLHSTPPFSQERLLLMLVTGRSWERAEEDFQQGKIPVNVAKDVVDYLFLGGKGEQLAQRLGITDVSITYGDHERGILLKKRLSEKLETVYHVGQEVAGDSVQNVTQRLGAQYNVTEHVSLGVEKDISKEKKDSNDTLMLKFEKTF